MQDAPPANVPAAGEDGVRLGHIVVLSREKSVGVIAGLVPETGTGKVNVALPSFSTATALGLSDVVVPTVPVTKPIVGGVLRSSFTRVVPWAMYTLPRLSTVMPTG